MDEETYLKLVKEHPEMVDLIHYVRPRKGRRGYWRTIPYTYFDPHPNQLKIRIALAETAYKNWGIKGLECYEGKMIPPVAARNAEALKGKKFKKPDVEKTFKKLKKLAKLIALQYKVEKEGELPYPEG